MALVTYGNGIINISGKLAGNIHQRDKSGHHITTAQRRVKSRSPTQMIQRRAFSRARSFSKVNRTVSYNIYRALNNLVLKEPPINYSPPHLAEPKNEV